MNLIDTLIVQADQALRTLVPGAVVAAEANPAENRSDSAEFDSLARARSAALMRINHTGEVCAQALYQGQALTARDAGVRTDMQQASQEEFDHLAWCESRLQELQSGPSLLNPLFYGISFGMGALAGAIGDKWSLGFVAETERQVCRHLQEHLEQLPAGDLRSREILQRMLQDEGTHARNAEQAGAAPLPAPVPQAMQWLARVMKATTARL